MRIKSVTIEGFRGFNEQRTLHFHHSLTAVYAPNSYGKTSITEAFEWLLYGITSRVERADSKEEYKNSYRNKHFSDDKTPSVSVTFLEDTKEINYKAELANSDGANRFLDGVLVPEWPITPILHRVPKPFVLQHALKHLLLASPDERFRGFALLVGLEDLDLIQRT